MRSELGVAVYVCMRLHLETLDECICERFFATASSGANATLASIHRGSLAADLPRVVWLEELDLGGKILRFDLVLVEKLE